MIPLAEPNFDGREKDYILEALASNFVSSMGPLVARFEHAFADWVGMPNAVAVSNGTAAIHLALIAGGVGPGDEVWVSDFTFAASANPIRYQGACPVLVDSEERTWNLDPDLVVEELGRRAHEGLPMPKAIVAVHILGVPAEIHPIHLACKEHGVFLIEDAAEALGARYTSGPLAGRQVGTIGDIGCFSFNGNKIMTTGGGGMIVTRNAESATYVRHLSTQAKKPGYAYFHEEIGYNYRLTNLAAALGIGQLERLDSFVGRKREIASTYMQRLNFSSEVQGPPASEGVDPTYWLFSLRLKGGWERPLESMAAGGVQTRPLWTPLHLMPPFKDCRRIGSGRVAESIAREGLSLPCSTHLSADDQRTVVETFNRLAL